MPYNAAGPLNDCPRTPWNRGKLIGPKPPLRPKHVWSIRTRLMIAGRARDLAMFNLAIDSKLRGCDVVALRVEDVAPNGYTVERATVRQRKTGRSTHILDHRSGGRVSNFGIALRSFTQACCERAKICRRGTNS